MTDHLARLYIPDALEQSITAAPRRRDPPLTRAVAQDADQVPCGARREISRQIAKEAGRQHSSRRPASSRGSIRPAVRLVRPFQFQVGQHPPQIVGGHWPMARQVVSGLVDRCSQIKCLSLRSGHHAMTTASRPPSPGL
jgi:hypothetical protein